MHSLLCELGGGSGFPEHDGCFACGQANSTGLGLVFKLENEEALCRTVVDSRFQSYAGILHGGILASIADSAMVNLVHSRLGGRPLTGKLEVRYRHPLRIGEQAAITARILRVKHNAVFVECRITSSGLVCAEATATLIIGT